MLFRSIQPKRFPHRLEIPLNPVDRDREYRPSNFQIIDLNEAANRNGRRSHLRLGVLNLLPSYLAGIRPQALINTSIAELRRFCNALFASGDGSNPNTNQRQVDADCDALSMGAPLQNFKQGCSGRVARSSAQTLWRGRVPRLRPRAPALVSRVSWSSPPRRC